MLNVTPAFLLAGKATFTVSNPQQEHYTFRVRKKESGHAKSIYYVSLLSGPDNQHSYTYMGVLNALGKLVLTYASRYTVDSKPVKVLNWSLSHIYTHVPPPAGYAIQHAGRCARCARKLTHPESLKTGFGPECVQYAQSSQLALTA